MSNPTAMLTLDQEISAIIERLNTMSDISGEYTSTGHPDLKSNLSQICTDLEKLKEKFTRVENRSRDLGALVNIGQIINSSLEPNEVLRLVMDTIVRLLKAERGFLMLRTPSGELTMQIARNWEQESVDPSEYAVSRTIINRVISDGDPVLTTNAKEDPRFGDQDSIIAYNLRSILCVPLKVKDELTGVLYADNRIRSGIFTEHELGILVAFANQAAVAIENARLFESLRNTLAEVTELKNLMDNIFTSIASGVITLDSEHKIGLCNQAAENILMRRSSDLTGRRFSEALPTLANDINDHIKSTWQNDRNIVGVEYKDDFPPRGQISLSLNFSPLKNAQKITQGVAIVIDDHTEKKRLEAQRRLFERMVSPAVIEQLDPDKLRLGGNRVNITTLFADIRGFTSFSEVLDPERLVRILNQYLAAAADAVLAHEGTIDKFLGDAIMAWFNAPIPQTDHTLRAIRTALAIRDSVAKLKDGLPSKSHLSFGAGIHFGDAILGLVGTEKRLEYTAIGDSINTAKRIQENAISGQILISADAYSLVTNKIDVSPAHTIRAKGKSQPVQVYEVLGLKNA